jgi:hypothetical protein
MHDNKYQELSLLIDMLSRQTRLYYKVLEEGCSEVEYQHCKERILLLQDEIEVRRKTVDFPYSPDDEVIP